MTGAVKSVHLISNFLDLKLMSLQLLRATWETEIFFTVLNNVLRVCLSFSQYSLRFENKGNYLQKFDNYNRGLLCYLLIKMIPIRTTNFCAELIKKAKPIIGIITTSIHT